jgi:hypothetical protein
MPRYGIEYQNKGVKFSRETTAKTAKDAEAINNKFKLKGQVNEIVSTEKTNIK